MFTKDQIECVCEVLFQSGDTDRLSRFLWSLPLTNDIQSSESVLKAKAALAFYEQNFFEFYYFQNVGGGSGGEVTIILENEKLTDATFYRIIRGYDHRVLALNMEDNF
uniref:Homeobox protein SIX1 N-terminal SD domain-containing protein n=1 Tax=Megaselia scalaris TaxID=36166 RepID=T1GZU5_MEGSC